MHPPPPLYWFSVTPPPLKVGFFSNPPKYLKLFLSLNISHFYLFLCEYCTPPPEKSHPLLPSNPSLKVEVLSSPLFGWKFNPPRSRKVGGAHYAKRAKIALYKDTFSKKSFILAITVIFRKK